MKNFLKKQRELLVVFAYAGLVAALVYFLILPLLSRIEGVNDQIQEESLKKDIIGRQLEELPKLRQQYETLMENEGSIDVLLDRDAAVPLIERLEKLAEDSGNKIEISTAAGAPVQKNTKAAAAKKTENTEIPLAESLPSADYLQMKIVLTGDYGTIYDFVRLLENFEYYSDVISVQVNRSKETRGNPSPFSPGSAAGAKKTTDGADQGNLTASLDVAFYTKK